MWGGRTDLLGLAREFECEVEVWCGGGRADGALARMQAEVGVFERLLCGAAPGGVPGDHRVQQRDGAGGQPGAQHLPRGEIFSYGHCQKCSLKIKAAR